MFRYEKELNLYEEDEARLEELKETYRQIVDYLDRKMEKGSKAGSQGGRKLCRADKAAWFIKMRKMRKR